VFFIFLLFDFKNNYLIYLEVIFFYKKTPYYNYICIYTIEATFKQIIILKIIQFLLFKLVFQFKLFKPVISIHSDAKTQIKGRPRIRIQWPAGLYSTL